MDSSEKFAKEYLELSGFKNIAFEPDGNVPPDFVIDGRIAIEVRRLNQNEEIDGCNSKGLEETSIPLEHKIESLLGKHPSKKERKSIFFYYSYSRPIEEWNSLEPKINLFLEYAKAGSIELNREHEVSERFHVEFFEASTPHETLFVLGGCTDHNSGGWLLSEVYRNLNICIAEKTIKIAKYRQKYPEWWLLLIDHVGYSLGNEDRKEFSEQFSVEHNWDKVILVSPLNRERAYTI